MDLYDRFCGLEEDGTDKISVHAFSTALRELAREAITKQQIIDAFNLGTTEQQNLDDIIATYNNKATNLEKIDFLIKFHDVAILSEAGFYTKTKAKTELGF